MTLKPPMTAVTPRSRSSATSTPRMKRTSIDVPGSNASHLRRGLSAHRRSGLKGWFAQPPDDPDSEQSEDGDNGFDHQRTGETRTKDLLQSNCYQVHERVPKDGP